MTKVNTPKKYFIISGLLAASVLLTSNFAIAGNAKAMLCSNDEDAFEAMYPFTDIDIEATIKKLPNSNRREAQSLMDYIDQHDVEFETLMDKEDRLQDIICESDVEVVTVNLLDKLSPTQREEAEMLWQEIKQNEVVQQSKFERLDKILDSAE